MTDMNDYFRLQTPDGEVKKIIDSNGQIIWRRAIEKETTELSFEGTRNTQLKTLEQYGLVTQPPKVYYDSLTQKGKCTQDGTPTSSAPVDIMCNNGAIKWDSVNQRVYTDGTPEVLTVFENLLNTETNITGKYIKGDGRIGTASDTQYTDLIPVKAGETYVCSFISGRNSGDDRLHAYDENGTWVKQLASESASGQQGLKIAMTVTIDSGISYVRLTYGITDTEARVEKTNYDQLINTFYLAADTSNGPIIKDYSSPIQSPHNGSWKVGVFFEAIPGVEYAFLHDVFQNGTYVSGNILHVGFYEKEEDVTDEHKCLSRLRGVKYFTVPNEAHYVVIEFDGSKPFIFSYVGVVKVDSGYQRQTASVPMLLSVGDVRDEVELITGTYTHRCAACEYDGTQDVGDTYLSTTGGKDIGAIIVYPLATATTEQITAQHITMSSNSEVIVVANVPDIETEIGHSEYITPSPEYPLPLFCNNGELKWDGTEVVADGTPEVLTVSGENLLNTATNITGYYIGSNGSIGTAGDAQYTDLIPVKEGETYVCSLVSGRNNGTNRLHGYNANGGWVKQLSFVSASEQQGARLIMATTIDSGISYVRLSYGITDTEAMLCHVDSSIRISVDGYYSGGQSSNAAYAYRDVPIQSPYTTPYEYRGPAIVFGVLPGKIYGVEENAVTNYTKIVYSCYNNIEDVNDTSKAVSRGNGNAFLAPNDANYAVVAYINSASGKTFTFDKQYVSEQNGAYQPYVPLQTASVPMLLSVGDIKDEAELISGIKTSRVGVKVLTSADISSFSDGCFFVNITDKLGGKTELLSTHFEYTADSSNAISAGQMGSASDSSSTSISTYYKVSGVSTQAEAEAWVDEQSDLGTPIIVLYPLATETTESITPQPIQQNIGYNFVNSSTSIFGGYLVTYYGE